MRMYLVVAVGALALVACGSAENHTDSGTGGIAGAAGTIAGTGGTIGATGGSPGVDAGVEAGLANQDCQWLADCITSNGCGTQACIESCASQASTAAIAEYSALVDCISANPQCTTTDCLTSACTDEIVACKGGPVAPMDAGVPTDAAIGMDGPAKGDSAAPVADTGPSPTAPDAGIDRTVAAQGYTTSGSCDVVVKIPNLVDSHTCWDYTLTVTTNHNDGTEHYVAYNSVDVSGTQSACKSQSYDANQPGPWDSASISASNLSHKKQACDLAASGYGAKSVWTEGGSCALASSLGHCTDTVTNTWDPSSQMLSSSLVGTWSTP